MIEIVLGGELAASRYTQGYINELRRNYSGIFLCIGSRAVGILLGKIAKNAKYTLLRVIIAHQLFAIALVHCVVIDVKALVTYTVMFRRDVVIVPCMRIRIIG